MSTEEWRPVVGYEGAYEVSSIGRVRSLDREILGRWGPHIRRGHFLRPHTDKDGYQRVRPSLHGEARAAPVHRLVLLAFVGPQPEGHVALHRDGNPSNNVVSNLTWGTYSDNAFDAVSHGTHRQTRKTHCPHNHPYTPENTIISTNWNGRPGRKCRTCKRKRDADARQTRLTLAKEAI